MSHPAPTYRTTVDIEIGPFEHAKAALGTRGYKDTINEALRRVARGQQLQRGAAVIRAGDRQMLTPEELDQLRRERRSRS